MRKLLVVITLLAAACGGSGPTGTDVEIDWTFGLRSCDQAGVTQIRINVAGQTLAPNTFTCAQAGTGADLGFFAAGTYDVTVQGLDPTGLVTFQVESLLTVSGSGQQVFTLDALALFSTAELLWTFDGGSCQGAGVTFVSVAVDGTPLGTRNGGTNQPCSNGTFDGVTIDDLAPGDHDFDIEAQDSSGNAYSATFTATFSAGQVDSVPVDLQRIPPG